MRGAGETFWVKQEDEHGCIVAAIAMVTGNTYASVKTKMQPYSDFITHGALIGQMDEVLALYGYAVDRYYEYTGELKTTGTWPPQPYGALQLCQVLVLPGSPTAHMVVMLGDGTVLDPLTPTICRLTDYYRVYNVAVVSKLTIGENGLEV